MGRYVKKAGYVDLWGSTGSEMYFDSLMCMTVLHSSVTSFVADIDRSGNRHPSSFVFMGLSSPDYLSFEKNLLTFPKVSEQLILLFYIENQLIPSSLHIT
jgi:hypothetical protein